MDDKQLIEMAAKASFYSLSDEAKTKALAECNANPTREITWNPLINDGDAHRLAVTLKLTIDHGYDMVFVNLTTHSFDEAVEAQESYNGDEFATTRRSIVQETYNEDAFAATRRAIVRAAAIIGRNI